MPPTGSRSERKKRRVLYASIFVRFVIDELYRRGFRSRNKTRGVSEIIAALLMILVTVSLSVVIFSFATSSMSSLETGFTGLLSGSGDAIAEQLVVEQVTFNLTGSAQGANLYVRNVGINPVEISATYITNETNGLFVNSFQLSPTISINSGSFQIIGVKFVPTIGAAYGFTIATSRGNSFVANAKA